MEQDCFYEYYELFTEYGTLLIYDKYKKDPSKPFNNEIPETYEYFTGKQGTRGYNTIAFTDENGNNQVFNWVEKGIKGDIISINYASLTAYDFLLKIAPYLEDDKLRNNKIEAVNKTISKQDARYNEKYRLSAKEKNDSAQLILKKYLK